MRNRIAPARAGYCGQLALLLSLVFFARAASPAEVLNLHARRQVEATPGSGAWRSVENTVQWDPQKTALVICDMWNQHWCQGATRRVAEMAPRMNQVVAEARRRGVLIIHCPSDTMKFYEGTPQRQMAQAAPKVTPKVPLQGWVGLDKQREGVLPIDDSDGGCDDEPQCKSGGPWRHQIDALEIKPGDAITDSAEAYYLMEQRGIENVIVMGVHGNMCVLGRPFAVRQMVGQGKQVLVVRDMIDTMYNSRKAPFVSHFVGTDLLVEHLERHWCASITSADLLGGEPFHFAADHRPRVVFIIGENEYHTWETLPEFARTELEWRGYDCSFVMAGTDVKDNGFTNYQAIATADLLVLSARRRTPPKEMMALIRAHLNAGKPLVGIRTASHAFGAEPPDAAHEGWNTFDVDILGCNYQNHYNNTGTGAAPTLIQRLPINQPILTGMPTNEIAVVGSLYRSRNPAATVTPLLNGHMAGGTEVEPVAWVNEAAGRRVFYTSLGAPENFQQLFFRRLLFNGIAWALQQPIPAEWVARPGSVQMAKPAAVPAPAKASSPAPSKPQEHALTPAESLNAFQVGEGLEIQQVLAEPEVRQPVFLNFDERGRMWVVEYLQYPNPAGLKMLSHDSVWRAVYDKVPPPPPHHFVGADRISIYEDTQGNGRFDRHTVFVEGLNIATAVTKGRGGVWVLNPPYLLFYPDRNNDDMPDGDPEVKLSGFGLEDTHSVVNSLRWGPDGWLYGCQGSTVTATVMRPGLDQQPVATTMGQQIWRYHPETRRFEVFAEGGGNAFGCEMDAQGRIFSGHNGGDTRGFHYMQGAYLQKGFEKHGPLSNPYAFGYFPPMPHPAVDRFTHNFIVYDGGALPAVHQGKLFGIEPLQGRVVESSLTPVGASFKTVDLGYPVTTTDQWFRPVDIKVGPDGAIYVADWYDGQVNHYRNHEGKIDKANGRIYRLQAKGASPLAKFDLGHASGAELLVYLQHTNKWFRQMALQLLGDRRDASLVPELRKLLEGNTGQTALEALWALNLSGGLDEATARQALSHPNPFVRLWAVRLLGDNQKVSRAMATRLTELAEQEPNIEVRAQLASSAKRLPAADDLAIVKALAAHTEDATDQRVPLLLWWALEAKCEGDRDAVLGLFQNASFWQLPLVRQQLLERVMRRYAQAGTRRDFQTCAALLRLSPTAETTSRLLAGFELAGKGRSLADLPEELLTALAGAGVKSLTLGLRQGDAAAVAQALQDAANPSVAASLRKDYLEILSEVRQPGLPAVLLKLLADSKEAALHPTVLAALQRFEDPSIGVKVLEQFAHLPEDVRPAALGLLASRSAWARQLVEAVAAGRLPRTAVSQDVVRKLKTYSEAGTMALVKQLWGGERVPTTAEMQQRITQYAALIRGGSGDPYAGRTLFSATCGACHQLFGLGGKIGPDLTPYQRGDLDTMLLNIVNPSAEIREGFENYLVTTKDGRTLSGFLADRDNQVVVLRGLDGLNQVLPQSEVATMKSTGVSLMPEGILEAFNEAQVRDLFAYLRSSQPLVGSATQNAGQLPANR